MGGTKIAHKLTVLSAVSARDGFGFIYKSCSLWVGFLLLCCFHMMLFRPFQLILLALSFHSLCPLLIDIHSFSFHFFAQREQCLKDNEISLQRHFESCPWEKFGRLRQNGNFHVNDKCAIRGKMELDPLTHGAKVE